MEWKNQLRNSHRTKPQLKHDLEALKADMFLPFYYELEDYCNGLIEVKEMARRIRLKMVVFQDEELQRAILIRTKSFISKYCRLNDEENIDSHSLLSALFNEILTQDEDPEIIRINDFFRSKLDETLAA